MALAKFCVFCGKKPENKTKEHIIPQWLIRLTGDPNREINLGINMGQLLTAKDLKIRKMSFSSFHFPACNTCNNEFSKLEDETKIIVEKILKDDYLSNVEINTLLNWFDKVRIGLWLGALLLDRDIAPVDPHFHIKSRIAKKDRCLFTYKVKDNRKGIQFVGFNTPAFLSNPCCFCLSINNYYFFNISSDQLFSKNIGFPFPITKKYLQNDKRLEFFFNKGAGKIKTPLMREQFMFSNSKIYQPIFDSESLNATNGLADIYKTDYVKQNCLDFENGLGSLFYSENNSIQKLDNDTDLCLTPNKAMYEREEFNPKIVKQVLSTQLHLIEQAPSLENLTKESKKNLRDQLHDTIKFQKAFMKFKL